MIKLKKTESSRCGLIFSVVLSILIGFLNYESLIEASFHEKKALFFIFSILFAVTFFISMNAFFFIGLAHHFFQRKYKRPLPVYLLVTGAALFSMVASLSIAFFDNVERENQVLSIFFILFISIAITAFYQRWKIDRPPLLEPSEE
ncbi:hypothetical protein [Pseudidiomarina sp.]|uniref:hypothetical protein n=1 Tax=Pseudidiomarina sp. TaxID=2081707 RepID=UPI003A972D4B